MTAVLCALLSGLMFYFSIQLGAEWWLAWLAPLPVFWFAFRHERRWHVLLVGWSAYAIGMGNLIPAYGGVLPHAILLLGIIGLGAIFALVVVAAQLVADRISPFAGVIAAAALWTSILYLISFGRDGTAADWAYSQVGAPVLIQVASLFGMWSVTFLLVFFSAGVAMTVARGAKASAMAALALFVANSLYGYGRIETAEPGQMVRVGLAGDDALARYRDDPVFTHKVLAAYVDAARSLAKEKVSLIVFPEKIAVVTAETRPSISAELRDAARETGATIIVGFDDRSGTRRRNAAYVVQPDGRLAVYDKRHLVPGLEAAFVPGPGALVLPSHTAVAICKDMDFPRTIRADAARGPDLFAVPAWDFAGDRWWHARLAIMRGVENGFAVARAAKEGLLTLSDAYGRVLQRNATRYEGMVILTGDLPRGPGTTLYRRIGDIFAWTCVAISVLLLGRALMRRLHP